VRLLGLDNPPQAQQGIHGERIFKSELRLSWGEKMAVGVFVFQCAEHRYESIPWQAANQLGHLSFRFKI